MKKILVLGSGCTKCKRTAEMILEEAHNLNIQIDLEKDTSMQSLLKYQVMSTPGVVIDETLVHSGSLPTREKITLWLQS